LGDRHRFEERILCEALDFKLQVNLPAHRFNFSFLEFNDLEPGTSGREGKTPLEQNLANQQPRKSISGQKNDAIAKKKNNIKPL